MFSDNNDQLRNLMTGMTLGVVTNTEDPENLGRVKVKFLLRDKAENESTWARVIVPFAGKEMGTYCIPDVNDEVVVAFLGGQLDKPVIVGGVWSKTSKPPKDNEKGKNHTKMVKTKSGHTVTFSDEKDKEKIEVKSSKGHTITIDDKAETIEIKDTGGSNKVKIASKDGAITLQAEKKIELKAGGSSIVLDGTGNKIDIKSSTIEAKGMQVTIKGDATVKVESGGTLEVKASAMAQIKGAMVTIN